MKHNPNIEPFWLCYKQQNVVNSLNEARIPGECLSATQKSCRGLGSEATAPEAIKVRRAVRRNKPEDAMSSSAREESAALLEMFVVVYIG
jgi:hypothetical protein